MTTITARNTKAEIIAEAIPLIEDQAEQIQDLREKLKSLVVVLILTFTITTIF